MALGGLQSCPENQKFKCTLFFATWSLQGAKLQDDPLGQVSRCWLTLLHPRNPKSKCLNSVLLQIQHSRFSLEGLRQLPVQAQLHSPGVLQRKFGQCSPSHQKCPAPTASDPKLLCKKNKSSSRKCHKPLKILTIAACTVSATLPSGLKLGRNCSFSAVVTDQRSDNPLRGLEAFEKFLCRISK